MVLHLLHSPETQTQNWRAAPDGGEVVVEERWRCVCESEEEEEEEEEEERDDVNM